MSNGTAIFVAWSGALLKQLMLFAEDSPVSRSPSPANDRDRTIHATCGQSFSEPFARLSHDGLWRRMYRHYEQLTLAGTLDEFSETWTRAGSVWNGIAYRQVPLVPITRETGSGLLPTPDASPHKYRLRGFSQQSRSLNGRYCGRVNPEWIEWLMGYPIGWTDLRVSVTQSSRLSRSGYFRG